MKFYTTLCVEARKAMKTALIDAMDGCDDSVFDDYKKDDEYGWEPDSNSVWLTHRHGNHDWSIVSIKEIESWTTRVKEGQSKALSDLIQRENELFCSYGGHITEADERWNALQRSKIAAFYEINLNAYIGKINRYGAERDTLTIDTVFSEYTGQRVYNFDANFIVPTADHELAEMIVSWNSKNNAQPTNPNLVDKINKRIEEIGGLILLWS